MLKKLLIEKVNNKNVIKIANDSNSIRSKTVST